MVVATAVRSVPPSLGEVPRRGRVRLSGVERVRTEKAAFENYEADSGVGFLSYDPSFTGAHLCYEKEQARLIDSLRPRSLAEQLAEPTQSSRSHVTGRDRLARLRFALDSFDLERSEMQRQFHEDMIAACARWIFKDDLSAELDNLLLELGIDELKSEFMAITPRRFGKTFSVAMFIAAVIYAIEGIEISVFSPGRRASQKMKELVFRFLAQLPGMREAIIKHNVETIWIQGPGGDSDQRKIFSYPSNVSISPLLSFLVFIFFSFLCGGGGAPVG
jgi:hypothetical protein